MFDIAQAAKFVSRVDQRYCIERPFQGNNLAHIEAFPADPSDYMKGQIYTIDEEHELRHQPGAYGPDGQWPVVGFRVGAKVSYSIRPKFWLVRNGNLEESTADPVLQIRRRNIAHAQRKVRINREVDAWNRLRDSTVITQGVTLGAGARFDDTASTSSDPIAVFRTGAEMIRKNTGLQPDCILMNRYHMQKLGQHERIMSYAVNQMNLSRDRLLANPGTIGVSVLEALIGVDTANPENGMIKPGSIKVTDFLYSPRADAPRSSSSPLRAYANGPDVVMLARSKPGGTDGGDNGFGLLKFLAGFNGKGVENQGIGYDFPISGGGNDGILVIDLPDFDVAGGGTKTQILDLSSFFIQQASAAYLIKNALDASNTTDYGDSLQY